MSNAIAKGTPSTSLAKDWRPFFESLVSQMDRVFSDNFSDIWTPSTSAYSPPIDVIEEDNQYRIVVEVPGMTDKDVEVTYEDGTLTIAGEKKEEHSEKANGYHYFERSHGKFSRSLRLPHRYLKYEGIEATCKDGILTVTIPRLPRESYVKKIGIKPQ